MDTDHQNLLLDIFGPDEFTSPLVAYDKIDANRIKELEEEFERSASRLLRREQDESDDSDRSGSQNENDRDSRRKKRTKNNRRNKKLQQNENKSEDMEDSEQSIESEEEPTLEKGSRKNSDFPEFDELLKPLKSSRGSAFRRVRSNDDEEDLIDDADVDENAASLIDKMRRAAEQDLELNRRRMPAINKIKLLADVKEQLNRRDLHLYYLDNGVLDSMKIWLEPLPDGCLPGFDIRRALLQFLDVLPIDRDHLKESGIGKVVMFLYKHNKETDENRRLCEVLINKWSRPIFGLRSHYPPGARRHEDREEQEEINEHLGEMKRKTENTVQKSPSTSVSLERRRSSGVGHADLSQNDKSSTERPGDLGFSWHARIPQPVTFNFTVKPKSSVAESFKEHRHDKVNSSDTFKKLSQKMKSKR